MSQQASFIISDILSDHLARITGFGFGGVLATPYPISVKTGTSTNFRDNWCLGFSDRFIVGVWAGNFQAQPMENISGVTGAGQLWREVTNLLADSYPPKRLIQPQGVEKILTCTLSGLPAGPDCPSKYLEFYIKGLPRAKNCQHQNTNTMVKTALGLNRNFTILRPLSGEIYTTDPGINPQIQKITALMQSVPEIDEIVWLLDSKEIYRSPVSGYGRLSFPLPFSKGQHQLKILGYFQGKILKTSHSSYVIK
jgi:penicillin-binding protein 1C